jgi:hypothetical protein
MSETAQELIKKALDREPRHRAYCDACDRHIGSAYYSATYARDVLAQHRQWVHPETVKWDRSQGRQREYEE